MPLSKDSKPNRRRVRLNRMRGHNSSKGGVEVASNGYQKIARFLERSVQQTSIPAMFAEEDKRRKAVRKNYPKFAR